MAEGGGCFDRHWRQPLAPVLAGPEMRGLREFLLQRHSAGATIYPPPGQFFAAMDALAPQDVRVVIIGQDPYHGPGQAQGLCFSVPEGVRPPPSLRNILREVQSDLGGPLPDSGSLQRWARTGVLLLNTVLSVERGQAGAHAGKGWEVFTDAVVGLVNRQPAVVFMLWGRHAQDKAQLVDAARHLVLQAPHPSPYSADRGFFGCRHFSRANQWLAERGLSVPEWVPAQS